MLIISQGPVQKRFDIESPFFAAMLFVLSSKYFKKVFHVYLNKKSNFDDIKLRKTLV